MHVKSTKVNESMQNLHFEIVVNSGIVLCIVEIMDACICSTSKRLGFCGNINCEKWVHYFIDISPLSLRV